MSRIFFRETYIIIVPSFSEVELHEHPMLHLFCGDPGEVVAGETTVRGNAIFLAANVKHILKKENACKLFFLFDTGSTYAERMEERYLKGRDCCTGNAEYGKFLEQIGNKTDEEIISFAEKLLTELFGQPDSRPVQDERMTELLQNIRQGKYFQKSIADMAADVFLSESRLQHLFKETMGISIKNYMLIRQMEYAYRLVMGGQSITFAAMEAGFCSPAHLAYTCKKNTGIAISNVNAEAAAERQQNFDSNEMGDMLHSR